MFKRYTVIESGTSADELSEKVNDAIRMQNWQPYGPLVVTPVTRDIDGRTDVQVWYSQAMVRGE